MNWLRNLFARTSQPRRAPRPRPAWRPRLEALEERCVPTVFIVNNSSDDINQPGTLRRALAFAQNGDFIDIVPVGGDKTGMHITLTHGELYINHLVTIEAFGPHATIDGNDSSRIFEIAPETHVRLVNLFMTNGNGMAKSPQGNASLDGDGGAILNEGLLDLYAGCSVSWNWDHSVKAGGGIFNYHGRLSLSDSFVEHNFAGTGGGIYNEQGYLATARTFLGGNRATGGGGAITNDRGEVLVEMNSKLVANDARVGGAIFTDGGSVEVSDSHLYKNKASLLGGGIYDHFSKVTVSNSDLKFNSALDGGGIYNQQGTLTVTDSLLLSNTAKHRGGGIYNNQGFVEVIGSQLITNHASQGGGIYNNSPFWNLIVETSLFKQNAPDHIVGGWINLGGNTFI
jgi:predicted outer membrane repeat protein